MRQVIQCHSAPKAIGAYSQAIVDKDLLFISGQLGLDPHNMELCSQDVALQIEQVFKHLSAICQTAGGNLDRILKLTIYLTDIEHMNLINQSMAQYFTAPYPARTTIAVQALPKQAKVEIDAIMGLGK